MHGHIVGSLFRFSKAEILTAMAGRRKALQLTSHSASPQAALKANQSEVPRSHTSPSINASPRLASDIEEDIAGWQDFLDVYRICAPSLLARQVAKAHKDNVEYINAYCGSPSADLLLHIVTFNVFKAFMTNLGIMGLNPLELSTDEYSSPLRDIPEDSLPNDLRPTVVQRTFPHHAVYDLFPDSQLRDLVILLGDTSNDDICWEISGWPGDGHQSGLLVWDEPYRIESWEMTDAFFRKYYYISSKCTNLIESTNRWRAVRGEDPLPIEESK